MGIKLRSQAGRSGVSLALGAALLLPVAGWGLCGNGAASIPESGRHGAASGTASARARVRSVRVPPGLREDDGQHHPAPVSAIYMVAPRVLCIVLDDLKVHSFSEKLDWDDDGVDEVQGDDGPTWQSGPWKLTRAGGAPIRVEQVARDSVSAGSFYADYGWAKAEHANLVDLKHRIYLTLAEPLGSRETLTIKGPQALEVHWDFDDARVQTPVIQLNQVGYSPHARRRYAYVSHWLGSGGPLSLFDFPGTVFVEDRALPMTPRTGTGDAGVPVAQIDLANAPIGRPFRIRIPGVGVSFETEISESSVFRSFYVVARGLFHNRFGRDTKPAFTDWVRPRDDQRKVWTAEEPNYSKKFAENTPKVGPRKVLGGHHDAGDFDIRPMHYQVAMLLFEAYELNPAAFRDGQLDIPEGGNGIPDLLDEALYSLKGWQDLQDANGCVRLGIEATRHPWGLVFADEDPMNYWTYACDSRHTLRVAALFAQAARLVRPFSADRAQDLLQRARRAFDQAIAAGADDADLGRMLFATGELWRATGEAKFKEQFERIFRANVKWGKYPDIYPKLLWSGGWDKRSEAIIGEYLLGYVTAPGADPVIVGQATRRFTELAADSVRNLERLAHRHARNPGSDPSWGEDSGALRWELPCVWVLRTGAADEECRSALALSRDYALGANPMSMSWFTGLGESSVRDPLHADSRAFRLKDRGAPEVPGAEPVPGIPVYGPVARLPNGPAYGYAAKLIYPPVEQRPLLRRYADNAFWVNSNEFDVVHQALQALSMAAVMREGSMPSSDWRPAGARR